MTGGSGRVLRALLTGLLGATVLGGCGVPMQGAAEPLPGGALPVVSAPATVVPTIRETKVYFVSGHTLVPVREQITPRTASGVMTALGAGPPVDRQAELRTLLLHPLTGEPMLVVSSVTPSGEAVLQRTEAYQEVPAIDQALLTGQVVLSLAQVGITSVVITDQAGTAVPLALPDGRVIEGPVTAMDYSVLLAR